MQISRREKGGVTILDLNGKLTIGAGSIALREAVRSAMDSGGMHILLNMSAVTTMDSSGIGELVSAYTSTMSRGAKLKICNMPQKVQDLLQITQLLTVFDVFDDEDEAIASFA